MCSNACNNMCCPASSPLQHAQPQTHHCSATACPALAGTSTYCSNYSYSRIELCLHPLRLHLHQLLRLLHTLHQLAHVKGVGHATTATLQQPNSQTDDTLKNKMQSHKLYERIKRQGCLTSVLGQICMQQNSHTVRWSSSRCRAAGTLTSLFPPPKRAWAFSCRLLMAGRTHLGDVHTIWSAVCPAQMHWSRCTIVTHCHLLCCFCDTRAARPAL